MIRHKLVLLLLFLAESWCQSNETAFKPIDDRVGPLADRFLRRSSKDVLSFVVDEFQSLFSENVLREKEQEVLKYCRSLLKRFDNYNVTKGIEVKRVSEARGASVVEDLLDYAENHVIQVQVLDLVEDVTSKVKRSTEMLDSSERSFGLQKIMVPFMIGMQVVKSVLFAMFLPSILGGLGKVVGEGVKYLSSQRYPATGIGHNMGQMENFEFKDPNAYENQYPDTQSEGSSSLYSYAYPNSYDYKHQQPSLGVLPAPAQSSIANRYTSGLHKLNYIPNNHHHGSFYTKHSDKHGKNQDYKVFHNIPPSSLLLTNYDPFYSPLLSRMDSVFKQLGYETEACRERLICLMYKNPAKFAPYSNLISAQLSRVQGHWEPLLYTLIITAFGFYFRELNELRKPSSDNPDILRFFKYMKAAKDGQDGLECGKAYPGCFDSRESISPPMVKTFNEINKLVQARKFSK